MKARTLTAAAAVVVAALLGAAHAHGVMAIPSGRATGAPGAPGAPGATGGLAVGRGPTAYRVQAQPPAGSCRYRVLDGPAGKVLPDPACTPGATNPKVTQATLYSTICRPGGGYTTSIRPPKDITNAEKRADIRSYDYTGTRATAEYDHLISLELGGDPNDPRNLWVEPNTATARDFTNPKDAVEHRLNAAVCGRQVALAAAQAAVATNWTTAERTLGLK